MSVVNVALDPHLGVAVAAAEAFAQREAQTLFEEAISPVKRPGSRVLGGQRCTRRDIVVGVLFPYQIVEGWAAIRPLGESATDEQGELVGEMAGGRGRYARSPKSGLMGSALLSEHALEDRIDVG